jgi:transcription initiation factor TFIIIB Brf1 subunit/transcription initiation factor TFIIB
MTSIESLVKKGLKCPNCGGIKIRGGYHDWQYMDSFICEDCGLHWNEDFLDLELDSRRFLERGFIWVMCDAKHPLKPILNPKSADEVINRSNFVKKGIKW